MAQQMTPLPASAYSGSNGTTRDPCCGRLRSLWPFGITAGDTTAPIMDDGNFSVTLPTGGSFAFFGRMWASVFVMNNGVLAFGAPVAGFVPIRYPQAAGSTPHIAVYFVDVDTTGPVGASTAGLPQRNRVYYRTTASAFDSARFSSDVRLAFPTHMTFSLRTFVLVTWYAVGAYDADVSKLNTFQAAIGSASNGRTYVSLCFDNLLYTLGASSNGTHAAAGFDPGDGRRSVILPGSYTSNVTFLSCLSRNTATGCFMYQVDGVAGVVAATVTPSVTITMTTTRSCTPPPSQSSSPTPSSSYTASQSATGSGSGSGSVTGSETVTSTASETPSSTSTPTPVPSLSNSGSATVSPTARLSGSRTRTGIITSSQTASATLSQSVVPLSQTATATVGSSPTGTATVTITGSVSASETPSPVASGTATESSTQSGIRSSSPTGARSGSRSVSQPSSPSPASTRSLSGSAVATWTATSSSTGTSAATMTVTATRTSTRSVTAPRTASSTATPTPSLSGSASGSVSATSSGSASASISVSPPALTAGSVASGSVVASPSQGKNRSPAPSSTAVSVCPSLTSLASEADPRYIGIVNGTTLAPGSPSIGITAASTSACIAGLLLAASAYVVYRRKRADRASTRTNGHLKKQPSFWIDAAKSLFSRGLRSRSAGPRSSGGSSSRTGSRSTRAAAETPHPFRSPPEAAAYAFRMHAAASQARVVASRGGSLSRMSRESTVWHHNALAPQPLATQRPALQLSIPLPSPSHNALQSLSPVRRASRTSRAADLPQISGSPRKRHFAPTGAGLRKQTWPAYISPATPTAASVWRQSRSGTSALVAPSGAQLIPARAIQLQPFGAFSSVGAAGNGNPLMPSRRVIAPANASEWLTADQLMPFCQSARPGPFAVAPQAAQPPFAAVARAVGPGATAAAPIRVGAALGFYGLPVAALQLHRGPAQGQVTRRTGAGT